MSLRDLLGARDFGAFTDDRGITWKLRRTSAGKMAELRALATLEKKFNAETKKFEEQPIDLARFKALKVAHALVEPEADGDTLQEKAACVSELMTELELHRLFEASLMLDDLDLSKKVEDEAKN